jgi:hypothetical protein
MKVLCTVYEYEYNHCRGENCTVRLFILPRFTFEQLHNFVCHSQSQETGFIEIIIVEIICLQHLLLAQVKFEHNVKRYF